MGRDLTPVVPLARPIAFDAYRAGYGSAALLGFVVQPLKQEQQRAGEDARQESAEMSAGISVGRSLLPKAWQEDQGREAGMHWSLELVLAVLYEVHPRALIVFCMLRSNPACSCRATSRCVMASHAGLLLARLLWLQHEAVQWDTR